MFTVGIKISARMNKTWYLVRVKPVSREMRTAHVKASLHADWPGHAQVEFLNTKGHVIGWRKCACAERDILIMRILS